MSEWSLELQQVTKQFPHFYLNKVDLKLPKGLVMGLIGPNGAGKTTTIRIIMGLLRPDSGRVVVLGHELPAGGPAVRERIGFVSEDMRLYPGVTIGWLVKWTASFFPTWDEPYAQELLKKMKLEAKWKIKTLSRGQNLKVLLLLALARRPELLVMDEPTAGLDPVARHEFLEELQTVLTDTERAILFSSHITNDVERIADRVTFINEGHILESDEKDALLDRWRTVQFELDPAQALPLPAQEAQVHRVGRMVSLTTGAFSDDLIPKLQAAGAANFAVHRLTLEEIFLARLRGNGSQS